MDHHPETSITSISDGKTCSHSLMNKDCPLKYLQRYGLGDCVGAMRRQTRRGSYIILNVVIDPISYMVISDRFVVAERESFGIEVVATESIRGTISISVFYSP